MRAILILFSFLILSNGFAGEILSPATPLEEIEKARKRLYAGGRDEEDLKVLATLPEAARQHDERSVQREVFKNIFNQDMVEEIPSSSEADDH